jgi:glycosyltransferase involved in cell wall biosynthesis
MFTCWSKRQEKVIISLNLFSAMDAIMVHCQSMKHHLISLGAPPEKLFVTHYSVDHKFFSPYTGAKPIPGQIMSIGEIRSRDYPTLFKAVDNLPVQLQVAASGVWYARENQTTLETQIPDNVTITGRIPQAYLRTLYAQSQFVVLPVHDVVYSAGATGVLEASCMGRTVIATRSRGLADYVIDGETGILVEPGNVKAWRDAITHLLAHPEEARRMGQNARQRIEDELNLERYVQSIAQVLQKYL